MNSYQHYASPNIPLESLINYPYAQKIPDLFNSKTNSLSAINQNLTTSIDALFTVDFVNSIRNCDVDCDKTGLLSKLKINSLDHSWAPEVPVRLYHGTEDKIIPFEDSKNTVEAFKQFSNGATVSFVPILNGKHDDQNTIFTYFIDALNWFDSIAANSLDVGTSKISIQPVRHLESKSYTWNIPVN